MIKSPITWFNLRRTSTGDLWPMYTLYYSTSSGLGSQGLESLDVDGCLAIQGSMSTPAIMPSCYRPSSVLKRSPFQSLPKAIKLDSVAPTACLRVSCEFYRRTSKHNLQNYRRIKSRTVAVELRRKVWRISLPNLLFRPLRSIVPSLRWHAEQ
jgi:hypothetical protein